MCIETTNLAMAKVWHVKEWLFVTRKFLVQKTMYIRVLS